ncbi:HET-domain-containing protein [Nemania sp. NC0429]|nr:HET-domain-containing protein [Nemania sp. NC0429]
MGQINLFRSAAYMQEIQGNIGRALVQSSFGGEFLPENSLFKTIEDIDFSRLLPGASKDLITFIKEKAKRVFLTALLSVDDLAGPTLVVMAESFQRNGITDENLPVEDISKPGRCIHPDSYVRCRCTKCSRACKSACPHDPALNSFHLEVWRIPNFQAFIHKQWIFMAPVFKKHNLQMFHKDLGRETILPFIWKDSEPRSGHFSNVFHAKLHGAHQEEYKQDETAHLEVAVKELRNVLSNETGYNPETSWCLEVAALNELSELRNNHLIHPIAAFKWQATNYIVFPWANGGTLRDFWEEAKEAHFDLDRHRVKEFLQQFCGLAGALCQLHGTNTKTATALAEAAARKAGSPRNVSRSFDFKPQPPFFKTEGLGEAELSQTDNTPRIILSSEDKDNDVKHWRHGDLKPENILVFQDSTWLGTLKIADLGLAKQHQFATESRHQVTSTRHTTLHYKAPEAVTNVKEPRSRRYDVWSMGCIILESIIWLLYGSQGLDQFYLESKHLRDYTGQTLYFTTRTYSKDGGSELVTSVSEIAKHWITEILEKDPECSTQYSAIRHLLELVRDRLLVVEIPSKSRPNGTGYRATSAELLRELENIKRTADDDDENEYLFTGTSRKYVKVPSPFCAPNETIAEPKISEPHDCLGAHHLPTHASFQHALLDSFWIFVEDGNLCPRIMESKEFDISSVFPKTTTPVSLCRRCLILNFGSFGFVGSEPLSFMKARAVACELCQLLLQMYGLGIGDTVEVWRVQGGLTNRDGGTPILSIYRVPSGKETLDGQVPDIPLGFPKLADVSSRTYFEILRQWLKDCDISHTGCHQEDAEKSLINVPTRLLDLEDEDSRSIHLIETRHIQISQIQNLKYIALSHPWGDKAEHNHYCTTQETIAHHKAGIDIGVLPHTFKDAIQVTRKLGLRYLWIDSLCIIQGAGGDFEYEAKRMETVFSSAYCVIAATCASGASSGFLRSRPDRKVVRLERPGEPPLYVCESIDNFQRDVIEGPLNKRGWVLQERALARRTIYFTKNQTYWECGEGVRCETMARMRNNQAALLGDPKFPKVATDSTKGGRIRLYELLYKQYSTLEFTRSYDRPLAIAGLEQRLIHAFSTQGGYGVFARYFGRGLLWQRDVTLVPHAMKPIEFPKSQKYKVPSWSWMAYEGAINFMDLPFGEIEWQENEVRSPWNHSLDTTWFTTNMEERIDLTVTTRDFFESADNHIVYDRGERPKDQVVKCVVVGKRRKAEVDAKRIHYVLVVAQKGGAGHDAGYERIGVGSLPGSSIALEGAGIQAHVF